MRVRSRGRVRVRSRGRVRVRVRVGARFRDWARRAGSEESSGSTGEAAVTASSAEVKARKSSSTRLACNRRYRYTGAWC